MFKLSNFIAIISSTVRFEGVGPQRSPLDAAAERLSCDVELCRHGDATSAGLGQTRSTADQCGDATLAVVAAHVDGR